MLSKWFCISINTHPYNEKRCKKEIKHNYTCDHSHTSLKHNTLKITIFLTHTHTYRLITVLKQRFKNDCYISLALWFIYLKSNSLFQQFFFILLKKIGISQHCFKTRRLKINKQTKRFQEVRPQKAGNGSSSIHRNTQWSPEPQSPDAHL